MMFKRKKKTKKTKIETKSPKLEYRFCKGCDRNLVLNNYNFHKLRDGFRYQCKECVNAMNKERWKANANGIREYKAAWQKANKDKCKTYRTTYMNKLKSNGYQDWEPYKICSKCEIQKPNTDEFFQKTNNSKDGLRLVCKECFKVRFKELQLLKKKRTV